MSGTIVARGALVNPLHAAQQRLRREPRKIEGGWGLRGPAGARTRSTRPKLVQTLALPVVTSDPGSPSETGSTQTGAFIPRRRALTFSLALSRHRVLIVLARLARFSQITKMRT